MDKFVFFRILVVVICSEGVKCKVQQSKNDVNKIVGGVETTIEEYPYQAFLLLFDGTVHYQCGGSIISEYWVLTAAHCLVNKIQITVRIGSSERDSGGIEYETTCFYYHPMYNPQDLDYDVGVVFISQSMDFDKSGATPVSLAGFFTDPKEGQIVTVAGWGDTVENGTGSETLRVAEVPIISRDNCIELVPHYRITSRMICAGGSEEGGRGSCKGDSGGPAVLNASQRVAGITSFANGCGRPNSPIVYTNVGNYEIRFFILYMTGV